MNWALAIGGIILLIILHEFGHFVAAKLTGMRVERFFLFFPPKLVSIRRGETEYGIGMIPAGGFVKITGMNPDEVRPAPAPGGEGAPKPGLATRIEGAGAKEDPATAGGSGGLPPELLRRAYYNQPVWKRVVVILAGPFMNLLIAFVVLFGIAFEVERPTEIAVGAVVEGSPADGALQAGDQFVSVDGISAENAGLAERIDRFRTAIDSHDCAGEPEQGCRATTPVEIVVRRNGENVPLRIPPEYDAEAERQLVGFEFAAAGGAPVRTSIGDAGEWAVDRMWFVTSETVSTFAQIFDPEEREELGSVVGATKVTADAFESSTVEALGLVAIVSLSLALINLFPFLPLDGGHVFWSLVEKVRGTRVPFAVMERASVIGFMLVLVIFFIGLSNDIGRFSNGEFENP